MKTILKNEHYINTNDGKDTIDRLVEQGIAHNFIKGNIYKYLDRQGIKVGEEVKDLVKIVDYALMFLFLNTDEITDEDIIKIVKARYTKFKGE